jgi:TctA family transporter
VTATADHTTGDHRWLSGRVARTASDAALGCVLLLAGAVAIWDARGLPFGSLDRLSGGVFPVVIGVLMAMLGAALIGRAAFFNRGQPTPLGLRRFAIEVAIVAAIALTIWWRGLDWLLHFGPPEEAALTILVLVAVIGLARWSRLRALGMVLLGLLLSMVGMDVITGQLRLSFGVEPLIDGISALLVLAGVVILADAAICFFSPSLWLATFGWLTPRWGRVRIPVALAIVARVVAALTIAAVCYFAFTLSARIWDVGLVLALGVFGIAGKLLGWNRMVLLLASLYGVTFEQSVRQAMLLAQGDFGIFFHRPISSGLMIAAAGGIVLSILLSLLRGRWPRPASP